MSHCSSTPILSESTQSSPVLTARNPYRESGPDFAKLAEALPNLLGPHLRRHGEAKQVSSDVAETRDGNEPLQRNIDRSARLTIDFKDPAALRDLNQATLQRDFGIVAQQPHDRLCPPIPNRLNYLLWLQDVLTATLDSDGQSLLTEREMQTRSADSVQQPEAEPKRKKQRTGPEQKASNVSVLDIGTGATAIYPVLGCAIDPHFTFTATDIDETSLNNARSVLEHPENNVHAVSNEVASHFAVPRDWPLALADRVDLKMRTPDQPLIPAEPTAGTEETKQSASHLSDRPGSSRSSSFGAYRYHATMCNPPFYASQEEMTASLLAKQLPPSGACSGAEVEMITSGGEVAFVSRLIEESVVLRDSNREQDGALWYTSMLGKISSIQPLVQKLREAHVDNFGLTVLMQGQTRRWVLIWSHGPYRLPDSLVRSTGVAAGRGSLAKELPHVNTMHSQFFVDDKFDIDIATFGENICSDAREYAKSIPGATVMTPTSQTGSDAKRVFMRFRQVSWTRAARRAAAKAASATSSTAATTTAASSDGDPALCVLVSAAARNAALPKSEDNPTSPQIVVDVEVTWTYGRERSHFESFASSLFRKLSTSAD